MVRVSKIGVWDVDGQLIRDSESATAAVRKAIIQELLTEQTPSEDEMAEWIAGNWKNIENKVKAAMAGT